MSSAPTRIPPSLGRVLRGFAWTVLFSVLAAGGAGLIGAAWHAPGGPARAELTWDGDAAIGRRLDVATEELKRIADDVEQLAGRAKTALAEVTSTDPSKLQAALDQGGEIAAAIDSEAFDLRAALAGLPGDGPNAALDYSNGTLVRRAAILAAIDAAASLAAQWRQVSGRATDAAQLTSLIASHDNTVLDATAQGRDSRYPEAIVLLDGAILTVADVKSLRARLIAGTEPTVLDEWIERNGAFDAALRALYAALIVSKGEVTVEVQSANREMEEALAQLPPDRRTIIVIVAEVARGGLTQAVLAIDDASARIDAAIAEAGPA
jgi:DNA-directed RNA polymerase specialized sigma24 family protein